QLSRDPIATRLNICKQALAKAKKDSLAPQSTKLPSDRGNYGKSLSVVITLDHYSSSFNQILQQVNKLHSLELIIVMTHQSKKYVSLAEKYHAKVIFVPTNHGQMNVGRAVGAQMAKGDIVLFADGNQAVLYKQMLMDIKTAESGADMVLTSSNDQLPVSDSKAFKYALNLCMNRRDLGAASLLSGCTVMSHKAINVLGWESLLCPPLAQIKGMLQGLTLKKGVPKGA